MDNSIRALSPIDSFQARTILQQEQPATSSSTHTLYEILTYSGYFLLQSVGAVFHRIILLVWDVINLAFPNKAFFGEQITEEKVAKGAFDAKFKSVENFSQFLTEKEPQGGAKLTTLLTNVKEIAAKMGIKKEIDLYLTEIPGFEGSRGAFSFPRERASLVFSTLSVALLDKEELDFVIARELSSFKKNQVISETLYDIAILVVDVVVTIFISGWFIFLIEGASAIGKIWLNRKWEKEAELDALSITGNKGAKSYMQKCIQIAKKIQTHDVTDEELEYGNIKEGTYLRSIVKLGLKARPYLFTEKGDCRLLHFTSNPLSERLKYIEEASAEKSSSKGASHHPTPPGGAFDDRDMDNEEEDFLIVDTN